MLSPCAGRRSRSFAATGHPFTRSRFGRMASAMVSASFDHTLKAWDVNTGRVVQTYTGHTAQVLALQFSADGRQLASAGLDGTIRLWDAASGRQRASLVSRNQCVQGIAFTPDGRRLIACGETGDVEVWRISDGSRADNPGRPRSNASFRGGCLTGWELACTRRAGRTHSRS